MLSQCIILDPNKWQKINRIGSDFYVKWNRWVTQGKGKRLRNYLWASRSTANKTVREDQKSLRSEVSNYNEKLWAEFYCWGKVSVNESICLYWMIV